ncbi:MAG: AbrB/MazE/SpoVT family DNA-binding domain-containing protein [Methanospirillum sp.]|nr:AbrB/MazE/SpoVT family DNA-binding domain-containing protein [Methanospirillum sp.]
MAKEKSDGKSSSDDKQCGCSQKAGCKVESVLTVDDRGQMVLPKDVRERADIKPGDKLALISWEKEGSICCLALMKTENLSGMVKDVLSPLMNDTGA